jgi:hypothetical protein
LGIIVIQSAVFEQQLIILFFKKINTFNMNFNTQSVTFDIGGGKEVTIETGKMARQADGAVVFYWLQ